MTLRRYPLRLAAVLIALPVTLSTCKDSTPPVQTVSQVVKVSGDLQTDTVAQTLPQPIVIQARDAAAHPVAGATVPFAVGSGSVGTASVTTDAAGQAQTIWTLGQTAGNQTATV